MNYLKSILYYQGSIYSQLRRVGSRMRDQKVKYNKYGCNGSCC